VCSAVGNIFCVIMEINLEKPGYEMTYKPGYSTTYGDTYNWEEYYASREM